MLGLDFNFIPLPWENSKHFLGEADLFKVHLTAKCTYEGCKNEAPLTMRFTPVAVEDLSQSHVEILPVYKGHSQLRLRPAVKGEDSVKVSGAEDLYSARCFGHHTALETEAEKGFGREDKIYWNGTWHNRDSVNLESRLNINNLF